MVGIAQRCDVLLWPQSPPDRTTGACLYNNDTAESCVSGSLSVHTQGREELGHGVHRLPQEKVDRTATAQWR